MDVLIVVLATSKGEVDEGALFALPPEAAEAGRASEIRTRLLLSVEESVAYPVDMVVEYIDWGGGLCRSN